MTKKGWLALSVVAAAFLVLFLGARAQAWTQFRSGNNATVARGETIDSSLWIGARDVNIAGTVNGDVFCGAQNVDISGTVKGDVMCGAQNITISGTVEGSVRLGAQTVNLNGSIGRNATVGAQTINTDSKSTIAGDATLGGNTLNLNGSIGRDLATGGSDVNLAGSVGRDIKAGGGKISLAQGAKVGGGIDYTSNDKISIPAGATVSGKVTQHIPKHKDRNWVSIAFFSGVAALIVALVLLVTALVITALLPRVVHNVSGQAMRRPWWVLLTGFVASIVTPILIIILMITVIGIPLGLLLGLAWLLVAALSGLFSAYYLGRRLWAGQHNALLRVLLGGFILLVLYIIPFVGFFVMLAAFWMGVGMALLEVKDSLSRPKYSLD